MKNLKKVLNYLFIFLIALILFATDITVINSVTVGNGTYIEENALDRTNLGFGVTYYKSVGRSSSTLRSGENKQTVYYLNTVSTDIVKVVSWAKFENHVWKKATVEEFIVDFENKNPGWTVLAGVNADFFDINGTGNLPFKTSGAVVNDGNFYKTSGGLTIGLTNDGSTDSIIWGNNPSETQHFVLDVYNESDEIVNSLVVNKVNSLPNSNETSVYFGTYNTSHVYQSIRLEESSQYKYFTVENAELALPNSNSDFYGLGTISSNEAKTLNVGQFSIVTNNSEVIDALSIGAKIRVQKEWTGEFANVKFASGCGTAMLIDGEAPSDVNTADSRMASANPRTAIGRKADGSIVLVVNDGRVNDAVSKGTYGDELAAVMKHAGCVEAYNLDGGGSSTMVIRENGEFKTVNVPSDGSARRDSNCLLVVTKKPEIEVELQDATSKSLSLKINVTSFNGHTFDKLYASANNFEEEVVNNVVTFNDLNRDSTYVCSLYYKIGNKKIDIIDSVSFKTLKMPHTFIGLNIIASDDNYSFEVKYSDRSEETNLDAAILNINGVDYNMVDGKLLLPKDDVKIINSISINYIVTSYLGEKNIVIYNPDSKYMQIIDDMIKINNELSKEIFK